MKKQLFMLMKDKVKNCFLEIKEKQKLYTDEYDSAKIHMTHSSADSYARGEVRRKFTPKKPRGRK
jgi:hypothetical protein